MTQPSCPPSFTSAPSAAAPAWQLGFSRLVVVSIAFPLPLFLVGLLLTNVHEPVGFVFVYASGALGLCMPVFLAIGICFSIWKFLSDD